MRMRVIKRATEYYLRVWDGSEEHGNWKEFEIQLSVRSQPVLITKSRVATKVEIEVKNILGVGGYDDYDTMYQVVVGDSVFLVIQTRGTGILSQDGDYWYPVDLQILEKDLEEIQLGEISWKPARLPSSTTTSVAKPSRRWVCHPLGDGIGDKK